jgi:diguanylate cyclase (GGDEF)-like protein/PAS domain S-box-containing protein
MNGKKDLMIKNSQKNQIRLGFDALPASFSTQEALETIQDYQPDLVMINADSLTSSPNLLQSVRMHFEGPILYIVDREREQVLQRAQIDGPFCFIRNAFRSGSLRNTIEMALYKYSLDRRVRESEERYQIISEMVSDAAFSLKVNPDHSTTPEWVSNSFIEMGGYSFEDMHQSGGWAAIIHPEDQAAFQQLLNTLHSGKPATGEYRFFHKTGRLIWVQFYGQPRFDKKGQNVKRIYGALRNITKIKLTKEILYRDQEELRALFDNAPIGMAITSLDFHLSSINTTFCTMLGYSYRDLISLSIKDITYPDDLKEESRLFQKLMDGKFPNFEMEKRLVTRLGNLLHVTMHASLIRDSQGIPLHFITQYVDISERKENERSLEESYITFSTVLNSLDAYVTVIDMDTDEILFANQKAVDTFGKIANKKCWQMLQPGQNIPCAYCNNQELLSSEGRSGSPFIEENFYQKINAWMEVRSEVIRWIDNRLVRMEIATDITRHKRMEVEMHLLNGSLSESLLSLQERNREMVLLNKLSETLQSCKQTEEAYQNIGKTAPDLFNNQPGVLLTLDPETRAVGIGCHWGNLINSQDESIFSTCPAIKDKKVIVSLTPEETSSCPCVARSAFKVPFLCMAIHDQDKAFALLHLEYHDNSPFDPLESISVSNTLQHNLTLQEWEDLAMMTSSQLSLSLMNTRLKERLQIEAIRDPLTGLFNRRYMDESLEREFSRAMRHQHPVGVMMIDIDNFKTYNDQYGHKMGDSILKQIGAYLSRHFRGEDTACRYGGDEIVIILPEAALEETTRRALEINQDLHHLMYEKNCFEQELTTSIGVAIFPQHGHTPREVLEAADAALYHAKQTGRDRVIIAQ